MERDLEAWVNLPVVRINRGGLYVIVAALGMLIVASLSMTGYSLHNYAMLKRHAEDLRHYIASRTNMTGLSGNDTPAAGQAVDHLRRTLKSLGPIAVMPGLKPATPVKNKRTFVVQSINGTLVMIARQQERPTIQNPSASRGAGGEYTCSGSSGIQASVRGLRHPGGQSEMERNSFQVKWQ
ncbi:hypothetical protein MRX96_016992 [Rhipicephalus microplus]